MNQDCKIKEIRKKMEKNNKKENKNYIKNLKSKMILLINNKMIL